MWDLHICTSFFKSLPYLSFFLKIALTFWDPLNSVLILGWIFLFLPKNYFWKFYWYCIESVNCFWSYWHLNNTNSSHQWTWDVFPLICVLFNFLQQLFFSFQCTRLLPPLLSLFIIILLFFTTENRYVFSRKSIVFLIYFSIMYSYV